MSDSPRLAELERQRALIAAHLKWLDEQIVRERHANASPGQPETPSPSSPAPTPAPRVRELTEPAGPAPGFAATIGDVEVVPLHEPEPLPSKWGCWIAFAAMMLGLTAAVGLFIYFRYGGSAPVETP